MFSGKRIIIVRSVNNQISAEDLSLHELAANNDVKNLTSKISSPGQDVNEIRDKFGRTPLHKVALHNQGKSHFEVAEILLNNGANPNARDFLGRPPLWYLVENMGKLEILKLFLRFEADFTCLEPLGLLFLPAFKRNHCSLDVLKFLVKDIGLDFNNKGEIINRMPLLHVAAAQNKNDSNYDVIKYLLEMEADINVQDSDGRTPLHYVIRSGNLKVLELFLSYKADLEAVENILLEFFSFNSNYEVLDKLFSLFDSGNLSFDANQRDTQGRTPLHHAVKGNSDSRSKPINIKIIKFLLKNGANIDALAENGLTPLVEAVPGIRRFIAKNEKKASCFADFLIEQADFSVALIGLYLHHDACLGNLILRHLAKLKFLKITVHSTIQESIESRTCFKDYFANCTKELGVMSNTRLQNSWITFFNLLVDGRRKLKNYAGNQDFIEYYKNNDWGEMFPIYGDSLKKNFDKGLRRRKLFDKSSILLCDYLPIFNPNHMIVKDIVNCMLSKKDLSKFLCE